MPFLVQQRCLNHPEREAAARCPQCGRSFCRECVTEHQERFICAACLLRLTAAPAKKRRSWPRLLAPLLSAGFGLFLIWFYFYSIGRALLSIPSTFHQVIWNSSE